MEVVNLMRPMKMINYSKTHPISPALIIKHLFVECKVVETKLREEFAKICFETLLEFSLMDNDESLGDSITSKDSGGDSANATESAVAGRLAVTSLLHRFETVLRRFVDEERNAGKCPPSRSVRLVC